ncbi:hypothetical protein [Amycolatopsis nigrescens]|uniref:hypothetical protein n=1 Tax=Amycolatopsis nigrescens TaxID=381445 RepID=UPI00036E44BD|nr:hypothetical protein [Amycolatopsis nigrescens]
MGQVTPSPDLRAYLRSLDVPTLAELLVEQADRDPRLRQELELRAAAQGGAVAEAHRLLDNASPDLVPHEEATAYATKVGPVLDTLRRLLDAGTQADLAPLARRAVDQISEALGRLDDPTGATGDELARAVALYARACAAHPPPADRLADWILGIEFGLPGGPPIELSAFAAALGEPGLRRIRSTVDKVLAETDAAQDDPRRQVAGRLLEELAEISGDVDELVAILSAKPPRLEVSLKIVRVLRAAGRHTEAIAHAAKALVKDKGQPRPSTEPPAPAVPPVSIKDTEDTADTEDTGELVRACRAQVEELIAQKDAAGYQQAAKELRRLRTLHRRAGTPEEFAGYLAELVETHRRKTRLLAELRNARIALPKIAHS